MPNHKTTGMAGLMKMINNAKTTATKANEAAMSAEKKVKKLMQIHNMKGSRNLGTAKGGKRRGRKARSTRRRR